MNTCLCGCGVKANSRYIHGHNRRGRLADIAICAFIVCVMAWAGAGWIG